MDISKKCTNCKHVEPRYSGKDSPSINKDGNIIWKAGCKIVSEKYGKNEKRYCRESGGNHFAYEAQSMWEWDGLRQ